MSLIKCQECGKEVSDKAKACPGCGHPINDENLKMLYSKEKASVIKIISAAAVLCVGMFVFFMIEQPANSRGKYTESGSSRQASTYSYDYSDYSSSSSSLSNIKTGNQGALNKAYSYLNSSAFSYSGLIDQLEYHGFSLSEATYGVDNCGANWNEQALKKAKSYLDSSAFSYEGLIDQLEYSGFTHEQAVYGTDNCGADWNEQAVEKAKSYLKHMSFSRSDLIDQLEYEGFTSSQAEYGVNAVGY